MNRKRKAGILLSLIGFGIPLVSFFFQEGGDMSFGFFNKRQEVNLDNFCRDFYEKNILNPIIQGIDAGTSYRDVVKRSIVEVDDNFANIDSQRFGEELVILRFELFALAWLHEFGEKLAVAQSTFTKHYLHEKNETIYGKIRNPIIKRSLVLAPSVKH